MLHLTVTSSCSSESQRTSRWRRRISEVKSLCKGGRGRWLTLSRITNLNWFLLIGWVELEMLGKHELIILTGGDWVLVYRLGAGKPPGWFWKRALVGVLYRLWQLYKKIPFKTWLDSSRMTWMTKSSVKKFVYLCIFYVGYWESCCQEAVIDNRYRRAGIAF